MSPHAEDTFDSDSLDYRAMSGSYTNGDSTAHDAHANGASGASSTRLSTPVSHGSDGKPQYRERSPHLTAADPESEHDLICVGFGPASLAIAVALHDSIAAGKQLRPDGTAPRVLFIEKQPTFAWHTGMLLPGAKMQISFVKDLATMRDPRSEFTFLNYLHRQGRLVDFTNLGTFLPARAEYEDYMRWAASFFEPVVRYSNEVISVSPDSGAKSVKNFTVQSRNVETGQVSSFRGRNVVFATGGAPSLPKSFPQKHPRVIHSSQYANVVNQVLSNPNAPYRVAVVGAGQSAAEIFRDLQNKFPNSHTRLLMRQEFLRPSDDSPFVNCVFNPEYIEDMFPRSAKHRNNLLAEARGTNYGVVRLELIEDLYERQYEQRRELGRDDKVWPHRILGGRQIRSLEPLADGRVDLHIQSLEDITPEGFVGVEEHFEADLVIAATGYQRGAHVDMLRGAWDLLPKALPSNVQYRKGIAGWNVDTEHGERTIAVGRDYQVKFIPGTVAEGSGVWLQGCCEGTHGLSDTLLSVLATRSAEIVNSIFAHKQ
ncbi:ornithine monooxygenase [Emericellopsis atlantica]|uniref:L-ornithine N(5)-monooxygenase [NAD(P)H] n=1 Tax=Emericellopsis atlantica TaxID=2614577 RepID=A0A9P7ZPZ7_9HYPO|nr:ornithine monooxygenase [Emericellopsis atlantica]KAG9255575.1 ornithine monooxygenase [Emericellopsis atlantica]